MTEGMSEHFYKSDIPLLVFTSSPFHSSDRILLLKTQHKETLLSDNF